MSGAAALFVAGIVAMLLGAAVTIRYERSCWSPILLVGGYVAALSGVLTASAIWFVGAWR